MISLLSPIRTLHPDRLVTFDIELSIMLYSSKISFNVRISYEFTSDGRLKVPGQ